MSGLDKEQEQLESRKWKVERVSQQVHLLECQEQIKQEIIWKAESGKLERGKLGTLKLDTIYRRASQQVCLLECQGQIKKESRWNSESGNLESRKWKKLPNGISSGMSAFHFLLSIYSHNLSNHGFQADKSIGKLFYILCQILGLCSQLSSFQFPLSSFPLCHLLSFFI